MSGTDIWELIARPRPLIFDAENHGNVQFLSILIREYPDLMWKCDENRYTIFHIAVSNRQVELFKFIDADDMKAIADLLVDSTDGEGNNILHLAGKLAPPDRLNVVSGSALQMQRELLWFQVKYLIRLMHRHYSFLTIILKRKSIHLRYTHARAQRMKH